MSDNEKDQEDEGFKTIGINGLKKVDESQLNKDVKADDEILEEFKGLYKKTKEETKAEAFGTMTDKVDMPFEETSFSKIGMDHEDSKDQSGFGKLTEKVDLPGGDDSFSVMFGKDPLKKEEEPVQEVEEPEELEVPEPPDFEELKQEAYQEGFDSGKKEGFEAGKKEGLESGREEVEDAISNLKSMILGLETIWQDLISRNQEKIINLISLFTHKVLLKTLDLDNELVKRSILESFTYITEPEEVIININPEDYDYIEASKDEFFNLFRSLKQVTVVATPSVNRGGCRLETGSGEIDTDVETRFEAVADSIKKSAGIENE